MWFQIGLVIVELFVLILILLELRALRHHRAVLEEHQGQIVAELEELGKMHEALHQHEEQIIGQIQEMRNVNLALERYEQQIDAVRPLFTTLYTTPEELIGLAISFTEEANEVYAVGSIGLLSATEMRPGESQDEFDERLKAASPEVKKFVRVTRERILDGCKYQRIMDFRPADSSEEARLEILANLRFFWRILNEAGTYPVHLKLYHSPDIVPGRADYHFRCSDKRVDLRLGGYGDESDAAISTTDSRVVQQAKQCYGSLLTRDSTKGMSLDDLNKVYDLLVEGNIEGLRDYLATKPPSQLQISAKSQSTSSNGM